MSSPQPQPKVLIAIGTRPEVIKMAPLYYELKNRGIQPVLLHTGQHIEMAASLYELFDIIPDYNLILSRASLLPDEEKSFCELSVLSSLLLQKISSAMMEVDPAVVFVHGDTSSAFISALAAFYQKRPVAHVEAGLRSHKEYNPFPEEKNRTLIGQLARWHFAPTERAEKNLLCEGVPQSHIHVVGNTVVEAAQLGAKKLDSYRAKHTAVAAGKPDLISKLSQYLEKYKLMLLTVHRRENHGDHIASIAHAILELMRLHEDLVVIWPVHPNPKVKSPVQDALQGIDASILKRLYVTAPLSYPVLLWVLKHSWLVLTDSGGIQEEAVAVGTPVVVLRNTTERQEIIEAGAGLLAGTKKDDIVRQVETLYREPRRHEAMRKVKNPYGSGTTAASICNILIKESFLGKQHHA